MCWHVMRAARSNQAAFMPSYTLSGWQGLATGTCSWVLAAALPNKLRTRQPCWHSRWRAHLYGSALGPVTGWVVKLNSWDMASSGSPTL